MDTNRDKSLHTPVLFLVFNRPETTRKVFEAIRTARPSKLFIAADGPRKDKPNEKEKCLEARKVASEVDWPCEVHTLFRDKNLGCGPGVSGAITWFFDHVSEGIILEDDTLPTQDFFRFCSELLEKYRDDTRIMEISGSCIPSRLRKDYPYSYFFSNWDYIWGWATWRRSWKYYDYSMRNYKKIIDHGYFHRHYTSLDEAYYMKHSFDRSYYDSDKVSWWSVQWGFARKINSGLVAVPTRNMVINLGLGNDATNTRDSKRWSFLKSEALDFPLKHPEYVIHDRVTDDEIFKKYFTTSYSRLKARFKFMIEHIGLGKAYSFFKSFYRNVK